MIRLRLLQVSAISSQEARKLLGHKRPRRLMYVPDGHGPCFIANHLEWHDTIETQASQQVDKILVALFSVQIR